MFKHHGNSRTLEHNLKIATLLSFVAGVVNVIGFISVYRLTTNVTGHFAFFVDGILHFNVYDALIYFLYIISFFVGSFVSNTLVEIVLKRNEKNIFIAPIVFEILILSIVGIIGHFLYQSHPDIIALSLLFAMGLQNSLVTRISNAVVRTTHLTGLFTDLGIEISQLFFYTTDEQRKKLRSTIRLRLRIIVFFFVGGIIGGIFYKQLDLHTLLIPAAMLCIGLFYDSRK